MTILSAPPKRNSRRAPSKIRKARRAAQVQNQVLTDQIMAQGAAAAQAAQAAATIDHGYLTPAENQAWLTDMAARLAVIQKHPEQNLGEIEEQVARSAKEPLRLITQRAAQAELAHM